MSNEPIHIISLGAGVQSSTMALMGAAGEITPMPVAAIFADTGDEPVETYKFIELLRDLLPFPLHVCSRNGHALSDQLFEWGQSQIPAFMVGGKIGKRQCTKHWKVIPIQKECRRVTGNTRKRLPSGFFALWVGISTDEITRMKDSRVDWITHRWPLVEKRMSRRDCLVWLQQHGYPVPPKSACVYCPYHAMHQWRQLKIVGGPDWAKVLRVSAMLAERGEFLTPKCEPLDKLDLSTEEERGQLDLFGNECEGMCGV